MNSVNVSSPNYSVSTVNSYSLPPQIVPSNSSAINSIVFPELNGLTLDDLQLLNENIDKQDEFLENIPQIREMNKNLDDLLIQIEELSGI